MSRLATATWHEFSQLAWHVECVPVPHKALAEVSKIGNYRRGELLWCMDGRASPLIDPKVVESLSLWVSLSLSLSLCLSIWLSISSVMQCSCRRKFRSQTSDNMDRWKAELGRGREKRRVEESRSEKRKSQKKEDADARKGRKVAKHFVAPKGRKVGSLKRRVRSQLARWEMKNCTRCGAKHICKRQVKKLKAPHVRSTFWSWDVEKVHAVVAWSACRSQNVQSTPFSDHFWKLRCRKSARRCGAKQISKSNVQSTPGSEHFWKLRCGKVHAVVARSKFRSQHVQSTPGSEHFWKLRCRKSARCCGAKHTSKSTC